MIEKHTFEKLIKIIQTVNEKTNELETCLNVVFDSNWLTDIPNNLISELSMSFFTNEQLNSEDPVIQETIEFQTENIEDLILHYCWDGNFGQDTARLSGIYERGDQKFNAFSASDLYDIIQDYLNVTTEDVIFYLR